MPRLTFSAASGARLSQISQLDDVLAPLVRRAQAGDDAAREELLIRCHATVYRWALVHTGDADDADDVAQEVLVRLCTRLGRYSGRSRFTTWLYQVTRNAALGFGRRLASRLRLSHKVSELTESAVEENPVRQVQESQVREIVMTLFWELPPRQREVFHLADVEGLTASEVAARLGMRAVTVRGHLLRARRALRARILARHPALGEDRES